MPAGLPLVKRLVEAQGGRISFESQVGNGTKFIIKLPLKRQALEHRSFSFGIKLRATSTFVLNESND